MTPTPHGASAADPDTAAVAEAAVQPTVAAAFAAAAAAWADRPFLQVLPETAQAYGIELRAGTDWEVLVNGDWRDAMMSCW